MLQVLPPETAIDVTDAEHRKTAKRDEKREDYVVRLTKGLKINSRISAVIAVHTNFSGTAKIRLQWRTQAHHPCTVAKGLIEGDPGKTSYLYLNNFGTQPLYFLRHMRVSHACPVDTAIQKTIEEVIQALTGNFDLATASTTHGDTTVGLVGQRESAEHKIDLH